MIPFTQNVHNREIHKARSKVVVSRTKDVRKLEKQLWSEYLMSMEFLFLEQQKHKIDYRDHYTILNILKVIKCYILNE